MHPFFAVFRIQCVELSVTWFVLGIYIYEKLRIHENTREFARLYEEVTKWQRTELSREQTES